MDRGWQLKFWAMIAVFIGLAIGLGIVLAAALRAAHSVEAWNQEYVTRHAAQMETEFWRMLDSATRFVSGGDDVAKDDLELRVDILFSRIAVFDGGSPRNRLEKVE